MRAMWTCPECGRAFANRNQSHFCSHVRLEDHFKGRAPNVVATFDRLLAAARKNGPVAVLPEKTRIAFQVRMSFVAFTLRRGWVDGHVVLARRLESPRFRRIDFISARNQVHVFRLHGPAEVDAEVEAWLAEAYAVGQQKHLSSGRRSARPGAEN
jgi:endogenous inhibitor of DNA gyrase (YacG/DUF329 family)